MNVSPTEPNRPSLITKPGECRWEGHMSDGVGSTYGMEPLAFLSADSDLLLLSGNRGTFRFPRAAVLKLGRGGFYPWFFGGVRIRHKLANFPEELVFKPIGARERDILDRLRALGYPVA